MNRYKTINKTKKEDDNDIEKIFSFTTVLNRFKELERFKGQMYWKDYPFPKRYESDADHTWRLSMMVLLCSDYLAKKINIEKALG